MRRPIQKTEECYMAKKVISFIVILLVFCTAGAAVLIGTSNFGLGFGGMTENPVSSAYALDRAGDIYYVNRTSTGMELVCVDSTGKRLFEKKLDPAVFGGDFTVSGIYVEHDKGIYLTVYEYDPETQGLHSEFLRGRNLCRGGVLAEGLLPDERPDAACVVVQRGRQRSVLRAA